MLKLNNKSTRRLGFTIVELLVVIVVIGILATVTIVAYTGVSNRAKASAIQADLSSASKQLELFKAEYGHYPVLPADQAFVDTLPCSDGLDCDTIGYSSTDGTTYSYTISDGSSIVYNVTNGGVIAEGEYVGEGWKSVVAGNNLISCGISNDDLLYCWGAYNYTAVTSMPHYNIESISPIQVGNTGLLAGKTIKKVAVNSFSTCVVASDDKLYCWGNNEYGQLGNNSTVGSSAPVAVYMDGALSGKTIKDIKAGFEHTCVIASDDNVYCWGYNWGGQLGNGTFDDSSVPVAVIKNNELNNMTVKAIALGSHHTCAIASNDNAYCWGAGSEGRLGNNSPDNEFEPTAVSKAGVFSDKTIKSISASGVSTCAIASDDKPYCWGYNWYNQIGDGGNTDSPVPVATISNGVLSGKTSLQIASRGYHTCVIASDNKPYCWGIGDSRLGADNMTPDGSSPLAVYTAGALSGKTVEQVSLGDGHTCVLTSDDNIYCWGNNDYGQVGDGTTVNTAVPVVVNLP